MNLDQLKGSWTQVKGKVKEEWGKLTDDELNWVEGNQDRLIGKIQEKYGKSKEEAQKDVDRFLGKL